MRILTNGTPKPVLPPRGDRPNRRGEWGRTAVHRPDGSFAPVRHAPGPAAQTLRAASRGLAVLEDACQRQPDRRVAIAVREWTEAIERDLGGDLSAQEQVLLGHAARTHLLVAAIDGWLFKTEKRRLVRDGTVVAAVMQRAVLVDSLARVLRDLGLRRRSREVDVAAILSSYHGGEPAPEPQPEASGPTPS